MKLVSIFALAGILVFASACKDDAPGYCSDDYFQDAYMTDLQGTTTTTFGQGATIYFNQLFVNTSGDSVFFNYSEPLVTYEVTTNTGELMTTNATGIETMVSAGLAANDTIDSFYPFSQIWGNLPVGSYQLKVAIEYQYMRGCKNGLVSKEQIIDFTIN